MIFPLPHIRHGSPQTSRQPDFGQVFKNQTTNCFTLWVTNRELNQDCCVALNLVLQVPSESQSELPRTRFPSQLMLSVDVELYSSACRTEWADIYFSLSFN